MTESDVATRYRQFIDAVDHVEKVSLQPYTLEITRAVQVLKVRDNKWEGKTCYSDSYLLGEKGMSGWSDFREGMGRGLRS